MIEIKDLLPLIIVVIPISVLSILMTIAFSLAIIKLIKEEWKR